MSHTDQLHIQVIEAQCDVFRRARHELGLTLKIIATRSGVPEANLKYYNGHGAMPITALLRLRKIIPDTLLSLILLPGDALMVASECDDNDHDTAAERCDNVSTLVRRARHPDSPQGVDIADCEASAIRSARKACGA